MLCPLRVDIELPNSLFPRHPTCQGPINHRSSSFSPASPAQLVNNDSNMVVHVWADIAQEDSGKDRDSSESNANIIHPGIGCSEGLLSSVNDIIPDCKIAIDTWKILDLFGKRSTGENDGILDGSAVKNTMLDKRGGNLELQLWDYLAVENVVVGRVPDGASNDTDGESESGDGRDEVVGTDNSGDDGSWNNDSADTETSNDEDWVDSVEVVRSCDGHGTAAYCHHDGRDDHEGLHALED